MILSYTNTKLLEEKLKNSGFKIGYVAEQLNISRTTLYNKIRGKNDFYSKEIIQLSEILNLSNDEISNIFFDKKVAKKETF